LVEIVPSINNESMEFILLVELSHYVRKLRALVTLPEPQDPRFLPPTHFLHESGSF